MNIALDMSPLAFALSFGLVLASAVLSWFFKLGLHQDILVAGIRLVLQLGLAGLIFQYVFTSDWPGWGLILLTAMTLMAARNASKRGPQIKGSFWIALVALVANVVLTLLVFVGSGTIRFEVSEIVPITGMIVGNSMTAIGLVYTDFIRYFKDWSQMILERLALGANARQASQGVIQQTIANGMIPTIDSAKTMGIVSLPGMMMGMLFAGTSPLQAVLYQTIIIFMTLSIAALSTFITSLLSYRQFFDDRDRLDHPTND
ncbi:ABC transporter permease [Hutsoniella sourekii]